MKKIILIAAIAVCSISSYAQVSFGAQLGANIGFGHAKDDFYNSSFAYAALGNNPKVGPVAGVVAEVEFGALSFRPELNYIQRGSKTGISGYNDNKFSLNYVELPLNVVYNLELGKTGKAFFGLGPNLAYGLGGKIKTTDTYNGGTYTTKVKFDGKKEAELNINDDKAHFKGFDMGADIIAGFQMKMGVFARVAFTYGFSNLYPDKTYEDSGVNYDQSYKNRGVSITVGYMLQSKKK